MKRVILLSVSILLISLAYSFAEVPCKINYQGRLIKDNVPVDGTKTMVFSIYNDAVAVTPPLWTSGEVDVTVHNGLFRYVIGSGGTDLSGMDWTAGQTLYLEVVIDGETLTPREELYAYPYAINSHLLEGEAKDYFLNTSIGTQKKDGGLNIMGNVGIGTTSPGQKLEVNGNLKLSTGNPYIYSGGSYIVIPNGLYVSGGITYIKGSLRPRGGIYNDSASYLTISGGTSGNTYFSGNVGIGTTSPGAKLDVQGGAIKATGGLIIETRTSDPTSPVTGQTWLRTDINP